MLACAQAGRLAPRKAARFSAADGRNWPAVPAVLMRSRVVIQDGRSNGLDVGRLTCRRREMNRTSIAASASQTPYETENHQTIQSFKIQSVTDRRLGR